MLHIHPGWPILRPGLLLRRCVLLDHILGSLCRRRLVWEEVLLQHIGQAGYADAEEPHPAGGVDGAEE
jgi:hypothetical protein